ncbi:DNA-directed RNA polymerase subunit omega [Sporanaerobacter sp. PP17-6a]|jgi:DNA-directed RNA polymerase subunit omega|uniref:DNA-directed RNA polymerase subunit omega n=1 Tax=Sporanaerobacter sp. PP17-6a TaxID=1891289 RepID=UPI0008A00693|nr:DNA-directed RNA polymerase subunit omega [Sporanaerobacter sp. PP17-6a]MBE6082429.1 DNA-directed RNA polymerase subunit omega [Tissierellaceae bacterium]SCL83437.1 DNA-directed RNA polymerase subunit omega [Sporanaerobacter sp. PP17-6a]
MFYTSINELAKKADSRYTLVILASKRARQIVDGSKPYITTDSTKPVSIAIEEIAEGKITYRRPEIKGIK